MKCRNCVNFKNEWCEKVIDSPCPDIERDCYHFALMTNADRIRAMSDEELATELMDMTCPPNMRHKSCAEKNCYDCWLDWLQQPVKKGAE